MHRPGGDDPAEHLYLGTDLSPRDYYARHAADYDNPHAAGICAVLARLAHHLSGLVLDLGCGDGLATKHLRQNPALRFVGVDAAPGMVARYRAETGFPGEVAGFGDRLPVADSVVAVYALHLATPPEIATMWWRLTETGATRVVLVSPFKNRPADPGHYFHLREAISGPYGPERKTIYGKVYTP